MSVNPYQSPDTPGKSPVSKPGGIKFRLVEFLVGLGVIGIIVALLLPARRGSSGAARRTACGNNLKQIAIALHNYHAMYDALPPAYTIDAEGKPLHSWRTLILPFMEQRALYDRIDLSKPWDDPVNKAALETEIQIYRCPSASVPANKTTYLAVLAPDSCLQATESQTLTEITDNKTLTLMVIEVDDKHAVPWMSPQDADEELILSLGTAATPPHPGGFQAACADGSTRTVDMKTKPAALRALISI